MKTTFFREQRKILEATVAQVRVAEILPFQDGNGRLSRVLSFLLLLQAGYAYVPYICVIEQSKEACYLALRQTHGKIRTSTPNWQAWLMFFLRALAEQVRRLDRKVEREKQVLALLPEHAPYFSRTCNYHRAMARE